MHSDGLCFRLFTWKQASPFQDRRSDGIDGVDAIATSYGGCEALVCKLEVEVEVELET